MIRRPVLTLIVALALAGLALLACRRLKIDTSLASLFDRHDRSTQALVRVLGDFSAVEELIVLANDPRPDAGTQSRLLDFAARLDKAIAADVEAAQLSQGVIYRVDPQIRAFFEKVLVPNAIFYLSDADFAQAQQRLTREGIAQQLKRDEQLISTPGPAGSALSKALLKDPLRLHEFLLDRLVSSSPMKLSGESDAFFSIDGRSLLIRVRGRRPVSDLDFAEQFTRAVKRIADRENRDQLQVEYTGAYAIAATSARSIRRDMIESVIGSVVFLQLLFLIAYRRPFRSFIVAFLPVTLGVAYGFGAYALLGRGLTPMTAVIGGILAGMAIDYCIALLSYYQANRADRAPAEAVGIARRSVGLTIMAAWATSVVGFAVIIASRVQALRDFSLLGTLGLTGAFAAALLVLPALVVLMDRSAGAALATQRLPMHRLLSLLSSRPKLIFGITLALFVASCVILLLPGENLPLESDLTVMHPRPNPPLEAQTEMAKRFGTSPGTMIVYTRANDVQSLVRLAHEVDRRLRTDRVRAAGVRGSYGLATLVPDPGIAVTRLAAVGPAVADRVAADFRAAAADTIFDPTSFEPYVGFLRTLLTATKTPTIDDLRRYPSLAETILPKPSIASQNHEAITLVFTSDPSENRRSRDVAIDAVRSALSDLPDATVTGLSVLNHDTELAVRRDLPRLVLFAVVAVAVYLAAHFRDVIDCLLAVLPAIFGLACLVAFMRLTGQSLNMINLVAFPLLIGIDVDYGIFVVSAIRRRDVRTLSRRQVAARAVPATAAVVLCAASMILGFGSLVFTSVPAVRSLGVAVTAGVVSCVAGALLLVVPLVMLTRPETRE